MTDDVKIEIHGLLIQIDEARSVWAGKYPDSDGSFAVKFVNGEVVTSMRLSDLAIEALYQLYQDLSGANEITRWTSIAPASLAGEKGTGP